MKYIVCLIAVSLALSLAAIPLRIRDCNNKIGYCNQNGKLIIPFDYDSASLFVNGIACVRKGVECFYINEQNEPVLNEWRCDFNIKHPNFFWWLPMPLLPFNKQGYAFVSHVEYKEHRPIRRAWHCIDREGRMVFDIPIPLEGGNGYFGEPEMVGDYTLFTSNSFKNVYNKMGKCIFSEKWDYVNLSDDGVLRGRNFRGYQKFCVQLNADGVVSTAFDIERLKTILYDEYSKSFVESHGKDGFSFVDAGGVEKTWSKELRKRYALSDIKTRFGLINVMGKNSSSTKCGIVDLQGNMVVPLRYDWCRVCEDDVIMCGAKEELDGEEKYRFSCFSHKGEFICSIYSDVEIMSIRDDSFDGWYRVVIEENADCWISPREQKLLYYGKNQQRIIVKSFLGDPQSSTSTLTSGGSSDPNGGVIVVE